MSATQPSPGDLAVRLNALLATLYQHARREQYREDISHRTVRLLQFVALAETPPCIDDVSRFLGSAVSTASEQVKRLQRKGLLRRTRSKTDERVVEIALTPEGQATLDEHASLDPEKLRAALDRLSARDRAVLLRLMEKLTAAT